MHFYDLCVQKRSCLLLIWDAFWKFSLCEVYEESSGRMFTIHVSKNEGVSCEVQTHLGRFHLARFIKKVLGHYHDWCVQKRICLPRSSDAFWRFSPCKLYKESYRPIFTIFASNHETACYWAQTHFGSSPLAKFTKKFLGAFPRFMRPVCCKVQAPFRSSLPATFTQNVMGVFSRFMCPKTELFAVKLRRIVEDFALRGFWRKLRAHFHDLCIQKWSCFLRSSDRFWKFSPCKLYEKLLGAISQLMHPKSKQFAVKFRRILEFLRLQGL